MNATTPPLIGHYISGAVLADNQRRQPVTNPATGAISGEVPWSTRSKWAPPWPRRRPRLPVGLKPLPFVARA